MSAFQDYIDLLASGDSQKIYCVLAGAGVGAVAGGMSAGVMFAPANAVPVAGQAINASAAGIGAVLGGILAGSAAYKACGGAETRGNLQRLFTQGKIPSEILAPYEFSLITQYGVSPSDARLLSRAAVAYVSKIGTDIAVYDSISNTEKLNAVTLLVAKLRPLMET